ncbi:MAG: 3-phosphoserine/phosphohydroxythreonine transaminase [bacterium]
MTTFAKPGSTTPSSATPASAPTPPVRTAGGRVFNVNAGPSILPEEVIHQIQHDIWDFKNTGFGILEHSHRAKPYDDLLAEVFASVRQAGNVPANFKILFMTGGSTSQNVFVPMNLLQPGGKADYLDTDYWSSRSIEDAAQAGFVPHVAWSGKSCNYTRIPAAPEINYSSPSTPYVHFTSNNTIYGTQWHTTPAVPAGVPLVCDACSDIFSRPIDYSPYGLLYASAQKNLGTTGATVVLIREDVLDRTRKDLPRMFSYRNMIKEDSRPNTPPHFAIYTVGLMAKWIIAQGGLTAIAQRNAQKAKLIYDALDAHPGFYAPHAEKASRSLMNIAFRLPSDALTEKFITEALAHGIDGTRGHRATGGIRVSTYNAFPIEGCQALAHFLHHFARANG